MKLRLPILFLLLLAFSINAQVLKYVKKGNRAVSKNKIENAHNYYAKAYQSDKTNYNANLGLGFVLSEYMGKSEQAIPYLETAYKKSPKDTLYDLAYVLGKCYHHNGEYQKALKMYAKMNGVVDLDEDDKTFQLELKTRMASCQYGLDNDNQAPSKTWYVANVGNKINTPMAEYVPVLTNNNELIFTSKRKDSPKEKTNDLDGKYFESMYISKLDNGKPQEPRQYTVPDMYLKPKYKKGNESVISISPDGKTLFVFRNGKIYETNTGVNNQNDPKKLSKNINFDYYQNHAYLSKDAKTLFFTSETNTGLGGNDIYTSVKDGNGNWATPKNLGSVINTALNEDSPYLSDDGKTLYFASNGHLGFGNYDVFKSELTDTTWSTSQNLGKPINSAGNDIFLIKNAEGDYGYFASSRKGGKGDMDIYKLSNIENLNKQCITNNSGITTITPQLINEQGGQVAFTVNVPKNYTTIEYNWALNNEDIKNDSALINIILNTTKPENVITSKIVAYCDTCYTPAIICSTINYKLPFTQPTPTIVIDNNDVPLANNFDVENKKPYLTKTKILEMGFDLTPIHFDLNKNDIRADAKSILDKNAAALNQHPNVEVLIYGFTDARADEAYNKKLSLIRAKQVKNYLIKQKVKPSQLPFVTGKGEQFLVNNCADGSNCTDAEHEQNRRVEFLFYTKSKK